MGNSNSIEKVISQDVLDDYVQLSYLSKADVYRVFKLLDGLARGKLGEDLQQRFTGEQIERILPQLRHNPFRDAIYRVFSSKQDGRLDFEDVLDLCSAFSENCPEDVRAAWAFQIYDFDGDNRLSADDLIEAVERLTRLNEDGQAGIDRRKAAQVARMILDEMDLAGTGSISPQEFVRLVGRMPDFGHTFRFKI